MIGTIVLTAISTAAIAFFVVCLSGFYHAAKERPRNGILLLLAAQAKRPLPEPRFAEVKISPARATPDAGAMVLQFPRRAGRALRQIS